MPDKEPTPELTDFDWETLRLIAGVSLSEWNNERRSSLHRLLTLKLVHCVGSGCVYSTKAGRIVLSLHERAKTATAWRPIATAAKVDGHLLLLGAWHTHSFAPDPKPSTFLQSTGYWTPNNGGGWVRGFSPQPQVWQPVPAPPEKEHADAD